MAKLSDPAIRKLRPGQELRDPSFRGFGIRAHASGATWFLAYVAPGSGQRRRLRLGSYPATGQGEARAKALAARADIERGRDPGSRVADSLTLRAAFEHYRKVELKRFRSGPAMAQDLERDLIAKLGDRILSSITRTDLAGVLDRIEKRGPVQANRVLQYTKAMFRRFVERGLLVTSPAAAIRKRTRELPRERVVTSEELTALWDACEREGSWFGSLVQLLMLTGMRRGEPFVAEVARDRLGRPMRLDLSQTKQGTPHVVTLPRQAVGPAVRFYGDPQRPSTTSKLGWSKRWQRLLSLASLPSKAFRLHDLRRTWATTAAKAGVDPLIVELCLGHSPSGVLGKVGAVYNRHTYEGRCAEAWQRTGNHLSRAFGRGRPRQQTRAA